MTHPQGEGLRLFCDYSLFQCTLTFAQLRDIARLVLAAPDLFDAVTKDKLCSRRQWSVRAVKLLVNTKDRETIQAALASGGDPTAWGLDALGWRTPMIEAIFHEDVETVEMFVAAGADPNKRHGHCRSSLEYVAYTGSITIAKLLLAAGGDPTIGPLRSAIGNDHSGIVKLFLEEGGADPNVTDQYGDTPLHYAAEYGRIDVIPLLMHAGADPNIRNTFLETPLHKALRRTIDYRKLDDLEVVMMLVDAGADPTIPHDAVRGAMKLAKTNEYTRRVLATIIPWI